MTLTATYGATKYEYTSIAGYLIRVGLMPEVGLQTRFSAHALRSRALIHR